MIKVGINGFGTIGRRVADVVTLQPDMKLMGIVKTHPDYKAKIAQEKGYRVFAATEKDLEKFTKAGFKAQGTLESLLGEVDIIVDATPGGVGETNKPLYEKAGVRAIFEGGEEATVAPVSFVAQCNFEKAVGVRYIRCVSCNTTGLSRTLHALDKRFGVRKARATIIRRAADPDDIKRGPIDSIVPDPTSLPSHHGSDVNAVLPHIPIITMAVKVPTTYMHLHTVSATLKGRANTEEVVGALDEAPRVMLVSGKDGILSTAHLFDYARDLGRPRADLYEICVWRESILVEADEVFYMQAVHQEGDVIPENIDAIRASMGGVRAEESMRITDATLKI